MHSRQAILPRPRARGNLRPAGLSAFTLVELLVVIAIIGILIALLLPAVQAARESARRMRCQNHLKQLALACHNYHDVHKRFPCGVVFAKSEDPSRSAKFGPNWWVACLPFQEDQSLHDQFDLTKDLAHANNRVARGRQPANARCPSDAAESQLFSSPDATEGDNWGRGNYAGNVGTGIVTFLGAFSYPNAIFAANSPGWRNTRMRGVLGINAAARMRDITDGTTKTFLLGEIRVGLSDNDRRGVWAMGAAASSLAAAYGTLGDSNGPNTCYDNADDIRNCTEATAAAGLATLQRECMTCSAGGAGNEENRQGTLRSQHPGGVNVAFCDGSVHFMGDFISTIGVVFDDPALPQMSVWDRLISSADGYDLDPQSY